MTTQELDNEFRYANVSPDKQKDPEIIKRVLNELVVRKYLLQQALATKLDREPPERACLEISHAVSRTGF